MTVIDSTVTLRSPVTKQCPFRDEIDAGELVITLPGEAPELHALAREIAKLLAGPVTHEAFTEAVAGMLGAGAVVVTTWNTGPFAVTVRSSAREVTPDADLLLPADRGGDTAGDA